MAKRKRTLTPEQRARIRELVLEMRGDIREFVTELERRQATRRELEERRRARLHRLTFGLLGRS